MKILLLGLGRANLSVAKFLIARDDDLFLYEDNLELISASARELVESGKIKKYQEADYELVITSPGFPQDKKVIKELRSKNIPIIDEIEFAYRELKSPKIIAVTGTNGKSTTAALISSILDASGIKNFLGGNISPGEPFSQALFQQAFAYYVLEVSSFQLMRIVKFHPFIAVMTNIAIDHLNWHRDFDEYKQAKSRIFLNQTGNDFAVLNHDDETVLDFVKDIKSQIVFFGGAAKKGAWLNGNFCYRNEKLFPIKASKLFGYHNMMNTLAAIAVVKVINIDNKSIKRGLEKFNTLPHRLEDIGFIKGVRYINNSMCTNEDAAIASFRAVEGAKIVIVGGKQKGSTGQRYLTLLAEEAKACIILGANAPDIARYFKSKNFKNFMIAQNMDDAIDKARRFAAPDDVILLNPGFASFDYFSNFAERGKAFKNAAHRN
jgi:UDP-N-acetylmuramoylalanine--D-glutamate ligase